MAKLPTGFKKRELIPEGDYQFMIEEEPKLVSVKKKDGSTFELIEFIFREVKTGNKFTKGFFPNAVGELLSSLEVKVDDSGSFESSELVGIYFNCGVKHIYTSNGKEVDNLINVKKSQAVSWDE